MENAVGILYALWKGIWDSLSGTFSIAFLDNIANEEEKQQNTPRRRGGTNRQSSSQQKKSEEPTIKARAFHCCALNGGVFLVSMLLFNKAVLPLLQVVVDFSLGESPSTSRYVWYWLNTLLSWTFGALWVLPLFLLSKVVNSLWFLDIGTVAYRRTRGRPQAMASVSRTIADTIFSVLVQILFLMQAMFVGSMPTILATIASALHMSMLHSLYCFEYKWVNMGWELHRRLTFIESNWPYFVGFGLPIHIITSLTSNYIFNGIVFSIVFPLFIVSGVVADPVVGVPPDFPLQLFSPVIAISNAILRRSVKASH